MDGEIAENHAILVNLTASIVVQHGQIPVSSTHVDQTVSVCLIFILDLCPTLKVTFETDTCLFKILLNRSLPELLTFHVDSFLIV